MISKYECYDLFFKSYFSHGDNCYYYYKYDCPPCRKCPFFEPEYALPCKLHREKITVKPNKTWNDIKGLVESAYSNLAK